MSRRVLEVGELPTMAFGPRDTHWWGTVCLCAIEGTMLVLMALSYFYVREKITPWPPTSGGRTAAWLATAELAVMLASCLPQYLCSRAAKQADVPGMRRWLIIATVFVVAACVLRWQIFVHLPVRWDASAYGSCIWTFVGLQTFHLATGLLENVVLIVLLFVGPVEQKHRQDVDVGGILWYFVVAGAALVWATVFVEHLR